MTWAVFRAMLHSLLHDAGALVMAFVMPVAFFVIFAEIFANAAGGSFELRIAVNDEVRSADSRRLLATLRRDPAIRGWQVHRSRAGVEAAVRRGEADAGLVVRADGAALGSSGGFAPPPLLVYAPPGGTVAGAVLAGRVQQAYATALPDLMVGDILALVEDNFTEFTPEQRTEIDDGLTALREGGGQAGAAGPLGILEQQQIDGGTAVAGPVAYYAGAIAFLFLLLSAAHGALTLLEERDSGVLDRIVAGPGGVAVAINGKFLFLTAQGIVQTTVIFAVAWAGYDVSVAAAPLAWLAIALLSAATAAGIALALVAACRSKAQAQTLSTATLLVMSAIGGSMVPRFFMPGWLQDLGWLTPNTWVLEAWNAALWSAAPGSALALPAGMLLLAAATTLAAAHLLARRLMRD